MYYIEPVVQESSNHWLECAMEELPVSYENIYRGFVPACTASNALLVLRNAQVPTVMPIDKIDLMMCC